MRRRNRLQAVRSAAQALEPAAEGALTMGAVGYIVPAAVVLQDRHSILLVQSLLVQTGHQQPLNLGQGQRWNFFLYCSLSRSRNSIARQT